MAMAAPLLATMGTAAGTAGISAGAMGMAAGGSLLSSSIFAAPTLLGTLGSIGSLVSGIMPIFSAFQGNAQDAAAGKLQANAAEMEALQLESQSEFEKTRALQEQSNRRQKLNDILNRQMSMTAGRGVAIGSGSDLAISSFSEQEFQEESDIASTDSKFRQQQLRMQANQARLGGQGSLLSSKARQSSRTFDAATKSFERLNTGTFKTVFG